MHPRSGRIEFDGQDVSTVPAHRLVRLGIGRRRRDGESSVE